MIKDSKQYLINKLEVFETYLKRQNFFHANFYEINNKDHHILILCNIKWTESYHMGWHAFLFEKNIKAAQQHFYICGRMDEYIIGLAGHIKDNMNVATTVNGRLPHVNTFTVLLSGSNELIKRRWQLKHNALEKYIYKDNLPVYIQLGIFQKIILRDIIGYEELLMLYQKVKKPEKYIADVSFFKALSAGDIPAMEKAIEEIASSKMTAYRQGFDFKDLTKNPSWYAGLLSWDGILYTKFAKMQGYNLQIKSPLVAIAQPLIDAPPLEFYDDEFDFLKVQMPNGIMRTREEIEESGIKIIE